LRARAGFTELAQNSAANSGGRQEWITASARVARKCIPISLTAVFNIAPASAAGKFSD